MLCCTNRFEYVFFGGKYVVFYHCYVFDRRYYGRDLYDNMCRAIWSYKRAFRRKTLDQYYHLFHDHTLRFIDLNNTYFGIERINDSSEHAVLLSAVSSRCQNNKMYN